MSKFYSYIDLTRNELRNGVIQNLAADPGTGSVGQVYYLTTTGKLRVCTNATGPVWADVAGASGGDFSTNTATSVDSEVVLFNGTTGKSGKRATGTGLAKLTAGVLSIGAAGTDYLAPAGSGAALTGITESQVTNLVSDLAAKAPLASPTFTGTVTVPTPSAGTDAVTKNYVDAARTGLAIKDPVRAASTATVVIASALVNGLVMDGVTLATGDRVLLKDQSAGAENGIYVVVASGAASRSTDADTNTELIPGSAMWVNEGTVNGDSRWVLTTNAPITLGSTTLTFTKDFQASDVVGGAGLTKTGATLDVGQGTGITVVADSIGIDTTLVARKATGLIGNASASSFAVTTGLTQSALGAHTFMVSDAGTGEKVYPQITATSTTVVTVDFGSTVPTSNQFRWFQTA